MPEPAYSVSEQPDRADLVLAGGGVLGIGHVGVVSVLEEIGGLVGVQAKLARKELQIRPIGENAVTRGQRDAIRFALLNLLSAELDALAGDEGTVALDGTTGDETIIIRILTVTGDVSADASVRRDAALAVLNMVGCL